LVAVGGTLPNAGAELTGDLGCAGTYRPQKQYGERVTIDLADFTPECQVGEQLSVSGSGVAVGSVTQAGPRGIIEIVRLHHRNYRAPIVIDSFVGTDPLHYLVVEANPADPHQGIAGQGVTIRYVEVPSGMASHGVE